MPANTAPIPELEDVPIEEWAAWIEQNAAALSSADREAILEYVEDRIVAGTTVGEATSLPAAARAVRNTEGEPQSVAPAPVFELGDGIGPTGGEAKLTRDQAAVLLAASLGVDVAKAADLGDMGFKEGMLGPFSGKFRSRIGRALSSSDETAKSELDTVRKLTALLPEEALYASVLQAVDPRNLFQAAVSDRLSEDRTVGGQTFSIDEQFRVAKWWRESTDAYATAAIGQARTLGMTGSAFEQFISDHVYAPMQSPTQLGLNPAASSLNGTAPGAAADKSDGFGGWAEWRKAVRRESAPVTPWMTQADLQTFFRTVAPGSEAEAIAGYQQRLQDRRMGITGEQGIFPHEQELRIGYDTADAGVSQGAASLLYLTGLGGGRHSDDGPLTAADFNGELELPSAVTTMLRATQRARERMRKMTGSDAGMPDVSGLIGGPPGLGDSRVQAVRGTDRTLLELAGGRTSYSVTETANMLYSWDSAKIGAMQEQLVAAGYFEGQPGNHDGGPLVWGDSNDEATQRAWKQLMGDAIRSGKPMMQVLAERTAALENVGWRSDDGNQRVISLSDPAAVRVRADEIAAGLIGRRLSEDEKAGLIAHIHGLERQAGSVESGDAIAVDTGAQITERIKALDPMGAQGQDVAGAYDALSQILAGPGGR